MTYLSRPYMYLQYHKHLSLNQFQTQLYGTNDIYSPQIFIRVSFADRLGSVMLTCACLFSPHEGCEESAAQEAAARGKVYAIMHTRPSLPLFQPITFHKMQIEKKRRRYQSFQISNCSSQSFMVQQLSSSIFPCSLFVHPTMVTPDQISIFFSLHTGIKALY